MFSVDEIADIAVQLETNGEKVYRKALKLVSDPELISLLEWLADEEARHAAWFSALGAQAQHFAEFDPQVGEMGKALLRDVFGNQVFSLMDVDFSAVDEKLQIFALAAEFEKDTILFYEMLRPFVLDEQTLRQLDAIIAEENKHVARLQELLVGTSLETDRHRDKAGSAGKERYV
jgi:rubrerythrin